MKLYLLLAPLVMLVGCASAPLKGFSKVTNGMNKGDVLELAGNPTKTQRWQGKDRWTYVFYDGGDDEKAVKEVHFSGGKVVYSGDPYVPPVSADQQDDINAKSNRAQDDKTQEEINAIRGSAARLNGEPGSAEEEAKKKAPVYENID